jgi:hypothetical protein
VNIEPQNIVAKEKGTSTFGVRCSAVRYLLFKSLVLSFFTFNIMTWSYKELANAELDYIRYNWMFNDDNGCFSNGPGDG